MDCNPSLVKFKFFIPPTASSICSRWLAPISAEVTPSDGDKRCPRNPVPRLSPVSVGLHSCMPMICRSSFSFSPMSRLLNSTGYRASESSASNSSGKCLN